MFNSKYFRLFCFSFVVILSSMSVEAQVEKNSFAVKICGKATPKGEFGTLWTGAYVSRFLSIVVGKRIVEIDAIYGESKEFYDNLLKSDETVSVCGYSNELPRKSTIGSDLTWSPALLTLAPAE